MLKVTTLPSGLRVATYNIDRKMAAVVVTVGAGKRYETSEQSGISHFLEHILCAGTKSYPTPKELKDSIESLGGYRNASTSSDHTFFVAELLKENLDQAIKTISEQLQDSLLKPEEVERQKDIIWHELQGNLDDPESCASRMVNQNLWPGQPLGDSTQEQIENLKNITVESLKNYMDEYYLASNMVICAAGDIDHGSFVKQVVSSFNKLKPGKVNVPVPGKIMIGISLKTETKNIKKLNLRIAFYGPSRHHQDKHVTKLLADILGHNLRDQLRYQRGLTYGVSVGYSGLEYEGKIVISGGFKTGNISQINKIIFDEVNNLKQGKVSPSDLDGAKARAKTSIARLNERAFGLAEGYSFRVFFNYQPLGIDEDIAAIEKVSIKEVSEAAKKYLSQDIFKVSATGPDEEIKELEKQYGKSS